VLGMVAGLLKRKDAFRKMKEYFTLP